MRFATRFAGWFTLAAVSAGGVASANPPRKPGSFDEGAAIIANARKILTPHGVQRLETVRIGGVDQWVSIRGQDTRSSLLLRTGSRADARGLVDQPRLGGILHSGATESALAA